MTTYIAGQPGTFTGTYYNEPGPFGVLADPTGGVSLTITYGTGGPVVAGPFPYSGASTPTSGQLYRVSTGVYAYQWLLPYSLATGVYVMNWTFTDGPASTQYYGEENVAVVGAGVTPPPAGDVGYWSASLANNGNTISFGSVDGNGITWLLCSVTGMDGVPTVGQVMQRAGDHGGYAVPQFYGPRPIGLTVQASAPSQALRDTARALMQQTVDVSTLTTFVYGEPVPKTLAVRRSGVLKESYPNTCEVLFDLLLIAPDPRKYGTARSVTVIANSQTLGVVYPVVYPLTYPAQAPPGSATVANSGNFETRPLITITGPITGPAVYNQTAGQTISFNTLTMGAADQLVIDLLAKVAYLNGGQLPADLWSSWWVLEPGSSQVILQGAGGSGAQMTISYNDAWM